MATSTIGSPLPFIDGLTDKRSVQGQVTSPLSTTIIAAAGDSNKMDAQLTTFNGTLYTAAYLQTMIVNDKIYALRIAYDSAGI